MSKIIYALVLYQFFIYYWQGKVFGSRVRFLDIMCKKMFHSSGNTVRFVLFEHFLFRLSGVTIICGRHFLKVLIALKVK